MKSSCPKLIVRLGSHSEKEYIIKLARGIDHVIVGGNLFEATPGATASLILKIAVERCSPIIDPMTYAFGTYRDRETGKVISDLAWIKSIQKIKKDEVLDFKRSYKRLAEYLGGIILDAIRTGRAINANTIFNGNNARELCASVLEYQTTRLRLEYEKDTAYKEFLDNIPTPPLIFAPYFYLEPSQLQDWITANILLINTAMALRPLLPLHSIICADVDLLEDSENLDRLADELIASKISGCWLWFSRFFEQDASQKQLISYRDLVRKLSSSMDVYSLHGGFFSLCLFHHGLTGVSHGIGYGEQKDVVPIIGQSTPTVRFYLPALRKRLGVPQIERCYEELQIKTVSDFHEKVCNCVVCKGVVNSSLDDFSAFGDVHYSSPESKRKAQTPAAAKRCRFHFLINRIKEKSEVVNLGPDGIRGSFRNAHSTWGLHPTLKDFSQYLDRWANVI